MRKTNKNTTATTATTSPFKSLSCRLFPSEQNGGAYGSVTIDGCFAVNIRVVEGAKGAFVSFPSVKTSKGEYKDTAFPITKEAREAIITCVMEEYNSED